MSPLAESSVSLCDITRRSRRDSTKILFFCLFITVYLLNKDLISVHATVNFTTVKRHNIPHAQLSTTHTHTHTPRQHVERKVKYKSTHY